MKDGEIVVPEPSKTEVVNRLSVLNAEIEGLRGLLDVLEASPMLGNFSPDQLAAFGGADALVENQAELIALVSGEMRALWDWPAGSGRRAGLRGQTGNRAIPPLAGAASRAACSCRYRRDARPTVMTAPTQA